MNNGKQLQLLRQQNQDLLKQIEDLELKIEQDKNLNQNSLIMAKELISKFALMYETWQKAIDDLAEKEYEYQGLIDDLKEFRTDLLDIRKIMKK